MLVLSFTNLFLSSDQSFVIGFVVPNQKELLKLAEQKKVIGSFESLCNNPTMEKEVLRALAESPAAGKQILLL